MRDNTWCLSFEDWLNSLSIFGCICFPENDTSSFFMAEKFHCAYASRFLYLFFCQWTFRWIHNLANMIGAVINFNMQIFLQCQSPLGVRFHSASLLLLKNQFLKHFRTCT